MSDTFECPKCKLNYEIGIIELWEVYEEDGKETEFDCPNCDAPLIITSTITGWDFEAEINE